MKRLVSLTLAAAISVPAPGSADPRDIRPELAEPAGRGRVAATLPTVDVALNPSLAARPTDQIGQAAAYGRDLDGFSSEQVQAARAVLSDPFLTRAVAEWIGQPMTGYDWQAGLPYRIELAVRLAMKAVNDTDKQRAATGVTDGGHVLDDA